MIIIRLASSVLLPCYYMKPLPITFTRILFSSPHFSSSSPVVLHSVHRQKLQSTRFDRLYIYTLCLSPQAPYLHPSGISRPSPSSYHPTNPPQSKNAALHPLSPRTPSPPHYHPRPRPSGHRDRHPPYPNHNRSSIQKHHQLHLPIRQWPAHPPHQQTHLDIDTNKDIRQAWPHCLSRPKRSPPQARGQRACQRLLDALPVFSFELHTSCGKGGIS